MPEAGRTPSAEFKRGDNNLAYGDATYANELLGLSEPDDSDLEEFVPAGDEDEFLFGATDRPAEPVTTGAPVGPGADFTRFSVESDRDFRRRVAESILSRPGVSKDTKAWAARAAAGE